MSMADERIMRREEEIVRKKMYASARTSCDDAIRQFAECAKGRTLSVVWACRDLNDQMNACLQQHTNPDQFEKRKVEFAIRKQKKQDAAVLVSAQFETAETANASPA